MSEKKKLKYDAFISYRHSEMDSFVAETVHHELEKFRLPANLVKRRGKNEKSKIERVFRDRDELPISADLSENITEALENSEFLIVICTPRLKESIWCKNEIQTFIKMYGREKVLAVLAEGEPKDSFPEEITKEEKTVIENGVEVTKVIDVEPLAADVRGKNKKEIKKKIKEEVVRLAAPIFECNYDEIKQRHREQILRRRIKIAAVISAVAIAFGGFSTFQALKIKKQGDEINKQYDQIQSQYDQIQEQYVEIEAQFNENLIKQSEIAISQANTLLLDGDVLGAKELMLDTYKQVEGEVPESVASNIKSMLSKTLLTYENGKTMKPVTNLTMDSQIVIICASPDYAYVTAFDINGNIAIWKMEDYSLVYSADTEFKGVEEDEQAYSFDSNHNFYFVADDGVHCIDCENGKEKWFTEFDGPTRLCSGGAGKIFATSTSGAIVVENETGDVLSSIDYSESLELAYELIPLSNDRVLAFFGTEDVYAYLLDCTNLSVLAEKAFKFDSVLCGAEVGDDVVIESITFPESIVDGFYDPKYELIDLKNLSITKSVAANHLDKRMYNMGEEILSYYAGGVEYIDPEKLTVLSSATVDREISDITMMGNGGLRLLLKDGTTKFQNVPDLSFFENPDYNINAGDFASIKYAGDYYAAVHYRSNSITIYGKEFSKYAESVCSYDERDKYETKGEVLTYESKSGSFEAELKDGEIVIKKDGEKVNSYEANDAFIKGIYIDEKSEIICLSYDDYSIEVRDINDYSLLSTIVETKESCKFFGEYDNYLVIGNNSVACIINRNTKKVEATVYGFLSFDEDSSTIYMTDEYYGGDVYKVDFYSLEDLVKLAE